MDSSRNAFATHGFGRFAAWVDLVNSEEWDGFGRFTDRLGEGAWLASFLGRWNFHPAAGEKTPIARLRRLRKLGRRAAERLNRGASPSAADLGELNRWMSVPVRQRIVHDQHGFRNELLPVRADWNWILARIAASLADTLASRQRDRCKTCANEDCRWVFYDTTKARTRRWCSDKVCGNRERVRRARARSSRN